MSSGSAADWLVWAAAADFWMARATSASAPRWTVQAPATPDRVRAATGTPASNAAAVAVRATAESPMSPVSGAMTSTRSAEYSLTACWIRPVSSDAW